jgi:hypothetical protein
MRPVFQSRASFSMRAVSAADSAIGAMCGGHGWPPWSGSGAVPVQNCRSAPSAGGSPATGSQAGGGAAGAGGRTAVPVSAARRALARIWARAVRRVCRFWAFQVRAWDWSQPNVSFPLLKLVSVGHC